MKVNRKRCPYCGQQFHPDPRIGGRQKVCGRAECQRQRKRLKVRSWRAWHKEHVAVHQGKQKAWAKAYPHYWRRYRESHPMYTRRDNQRRAGSMKRQRRSANETQILRRVAAIEECLLSTGTGARSAKEVQMALASEPEG